MRWEREIVVTAQNRTNVGREKEKKRENFSPASLVQNQNSKKKKANHDNYNV